MKQIRIFVFARVFRYDCAGNCSLTCGDSGKCDKITGHCKGGCRTGWTGDMCDKGKA